MLRKLAIFVCFCALFVPIISSAEMISGIAAVVNDEPITTYEVEKELSAMEKEAGKKVTLDEKGKADMRDAALNSMINRKLIALKIKELDIRVTDEELKLAIEDVKKQNNITQDALVAALNSQGVSFEEYKVQLREQLERLRVVSQEVRAKIQITEKELQDFYREHPENFQSDEILQARQIFFKIPPASSDAETKRITAKAESVLLEARSGKDFAELARKYSDDVSAKDGGDLGIFKPGEMLPEFEIALSKLKPGEVSELFKTASGLHLVRMEGRSHGELLPYEKVKGQLSDRLYKKRSEERFNRWLAELRTNSSVDIR